MKLRFYILLMCFSCGNSLQSYAQNVTMYNLDSLKEVSILDGFSSVNTLAQWLRIYEEIKNDKRHPQYKNVTTEVGDLFFEEELFEQAKEYYRLSIPDSEYNNPTASSLSTFEKLAGSFVHLSEPDSAYFYYHKVYQYREAQNDIFEQINVLQKISSAYDNNKHYQKALATNLQIQKLLTTLPESSNYDWVRLHNNLGYNYNHLQQFDRAIEQFKTALNLENQEHHETLATLYINIGIAYYNLGEFEKSIRYLNQARILKSKHSPSSVDEIDQLLSTVYLRKNDLYNALAFVRQSEELAKTNRNSELLIDVYYTSALIHSELYEYDQALEFFQKHLSLRDSFELADRLRQQALLQQQINIEKTEKQIKLFKINEDLRELEIEQLKVEKENQELALQNKEAEIEAQQREKDILLKDNELKTSRLKIQISETQRAQQELILAQQNLKVAQQEKEYTALQQIEELQKLELKSKQDELQLEQRENKLLTQESELNALELQKEKDRANFILGIGGLLSLILFALAAVMLYFRKLNQQLNQKNKAIQKQKEEIDQEKSKSDNLLQNILPVQVATELKETGKAATRKYENVTILFTDFKDFTKLVASIKATTLVQELNDIFSHFDDIMDNLGVEKIETIGDAYMAACGLPEENFDHAMKCIEAANQMLEYLKVRNLNSSIQWNMRIGIHSGPVIAGVVGKRKFAYDLFGDTVNTASRVESNGEAGKINISSTTYNLVKNQKGCTFHPRGDLYAKGKGMMEMWFVQFDT